MLLDIKKIFGTYDEPVTAALELDLSKEDFPGYLSGEERFGFCFSGGFDSIYLGGTPSGALFRGGHAFLGYASAGDARGKA